MISPVAMGVHIKHEYGCLRNIMQLLLCPHPTLLLPFADNLRQSMPKGIIYNLLDYLELIDWTGRQIRENKTGSIDGNAPPILLRIGIAPEHWIELCTHFEERFKGLVGTQHSLKNLIKSFGLNRKTNHSNSRLLYC